jgi:uncharacterized membrane protein YkoI
LILFECKNYTQETRAGEIRIANYRDVIESSENVHFFLPPDWGNRPQIFQLKGLRSGMYGRFGPQAFAGKFSSLAQFGKVMKLQSSTCTWGVGLALILAQMSCDTGTGAQRVERERAAQIALKELAGGYIVGEALERKSDRLVYRIDLQNGEEARRVTVELDTGRLLEVEDVTEQLQKDVARDENVPEAISLSQRDAAEYTALQAVPGTVHKWRARRANGNLVFRFNITNQSGEEKRVTVEARSQKILETVAGTTEER